MASHMSSLAYDVAEKLKEKRTNTSTKVAYKSKVKVMVEWLRENAPDCVDESGDTLKIPVQKDSILAFWASMPSSIKARRE